MKKIILTLFFILTIINASNITAIPKTIDYDKKKALLGKKLFSDKRLSIDNTLSCESCHDLKQGGDDNLPASVGVDGAIGNINAPTVFNAVFNFRQFWDGRAKDLEEQALGPIENPIEMAHSFNDLVKKLSKTEYKEEFFRVYRDGVTKKNIVNAIAEFEKTLITPDSRFDKYLNGETNSLTEFEKEGYELFINKGCISCHHGVNIGGNQYNKFGVLEAVENDNLGRFNVTKLKDDKYYFKVPTLRNIELTSPYFHDGRYYSLRDAVSTMAMVQLGRPVTSLEIDKIVAFLRTLTGKVKIIE